MIDEKWKNSLDKLSQATVIPDHYSMDLQLEINNSVIYTHHYTHTLMGAPQEYHTNYVHCL